MNWDYGSLTKVFLPPVPQQNQRRRDCVEPSALSHEHRKRNAFPCNFVDALIIQKLQRLQKCEASYSTVKQKTSNAEGAAPSEKRIKRCERTKQSSPNQSAHQIDVNKAKQSVEQIDPGRIP